jgi:ADP-heptose:LPS heptosyltransferase
VGDVVLLAPALGALLDAVHPEARITLLASPAGTQAAPLLPWLDGVITVRALWQDASDALPFDPAREFALIEELRERAFDAAVIFTSFSQTPFPPAYACYLAGIPVRAGQASDFGGGVLSHPVRPSAFSTQQAERNLHLLEGVGIAVRDRAPGLALSEGARVDAAALLRRAGVAPAEGYVAAVPGASASARRYDPARLGRAARLIEDGSGFPVVVLGSPREQELAATVVAAGGLPAARSLAGCSSVEVFAALLAHAALVVANNSSALHIADAFARPLVVTYSGTDLEEQWQPRRSPAALLGRPVPCAPCYAFDCPLPEGDSMRCLDVPPAEVAEAALALLGLAVPRAVERTPACAS